MFSTGLTLSFCSSAIRLFTLRSRAGFSVKGPATKPASTHFFRVSVNSGAHFAMDGAFLTVMPGRSVSWWAGAPSFRFFMALYAMSFSWIVIFPSIVCTSSSNLSTSIRVTAVSGMLLDGNFSQNSPSAGFVKSTWSNSVSFLSFRSSGGPNLNGFLHQLSTLDQSFGRPRSALVTCLPKTIFFRKTTLVFAFCFINVLP